MYSTAYNLWTFTWFVHFELPFRLKGTDKIQISKFLSNIYSILFVPNCSSYKYCHCYNFVSIKYCFGIFINILFREISRGVNENLMKLIEKPSKNQVKSENRRFKAGVTKIIFKYIILDFGWVNNKNYPWIYNPWIICNKSLTTLFK